MARMSREKLNKLKEKYNVDTLWSFSRYNKYLTDPYSYMLGYIKRIPEENKGSIYGEQGGNVHDILEMYYTNQIKYDEMIDKYDTQLMELDIEGYKYNKTDKEKNDMISKKYEDSVRHFFLNYKPIEGKCLCEKFIIIKVGERYFQGYIDFLHRGKDGEYIIEDFKTSTIYTGAKKDKESAQLLLYALGLCQKFNIGLDKVAARWNFLKYCSVESDLKTIDKTTGKHKTKSKNCVRSTWVKESEGNIKKWIKDLGYDELEIEDIYQNCLRSNSLDDYPELAKHFRLHDCYVYIDVTQENIDELVNKIITTLDEVEEKTDVTKQYLNIIKNSSDDNEKKSLDNIIDELWWTDIDKGNSYYFFNICGYSRNIHKPFDEYLKDSEMFLSKPNSNNGSSEDDDFNW